MRGLAFKLPIGQPRDVGELRIMAIPTSAAEAPRTNASDLMVAFNQLSVLFQHGTCVSLE